MLHIYLHIYMLSIFVLIHSYVLDLQSKYTYNINQIN